jgi:nucleotide-binding universal stress UspA family protein
MFKRLLVPLDGAELASRSIDAGIALARSLGAAITGFVAEPPVPLPSRAAHATAQAAGASVEELRTAEHAQRLLDRFAKRAQAAGVPFDGHFRHTHDIADSIVQAASDYRCDLILMVTHDRGMLGRLLAGSNTRAVLSRSRLPVLVMHEPGLIRDKPASAMPA